MGVLTLFTTFIEKNFIVFALEKDKAGMVSVTSIFSLAKYSEVLECQVEFVVVSGLISYPCHSCLYQGKSNL